MVTKVTADVMNLASPGVNTFNLQGTGVSSLDSTPIGVTTPDIGIFTNLTATNLTVTGTSTITGMVPIVNALTGNIIQPYSIINSSDGIPFINNSNAPITIVGGITSALLVTDGFTKLGDYVKHIIPLAVSGNSISHGGMVFASDNNRIFINNDLANIALTGSTAANLIAAGMTDMGDHIGRPFVNVAYIGTAIPNNAIVLSIDKSLMINKSGVSIVPTTGASATRANLITDGLVDLGQSLAGSIITDAVIATAVANNTIVVSSDGVPMINNTGVSTTPSTGTATAANLITDGFTNLQTYITTAATTTVSGITTIATNAEALTGTNATKIITPATLNSVVTQAVAGNMSFKGLYNAATNNPNLSAPALGTVGIGDYYVVSVAGTFFGNTLSVGDSLFSTVNNPSVFSDWTTVQVNVSYSTSTTQGLITLATAAEVQAGLEATKAVTSSTLYNTTNTPLLTKSGILNTTLATPAQISAGTVNDTIPIDLGGTTVARFKISDVMTIAGVSSGAIITDAAIATAVANNGIVISSDGVPMINNTGVSITPSTGTATAANLITDGFTNLQTYITTAATTTTSGITTIATNAEALLGTNNTKIITPATLNSTITQAVAGSLSFKGVYNAATNTPNLLTPAAGVVGVGDYYVVSVAGTFFGTSFNVGDSLFSTVNNPTVLGDWTTVQVNVAYTTSLTEGLITLATAAEVQAGLEATKAVTSATLYNTTNTPLLTKSGILNTTLATPAQISAGTVNDTIAIDFGGTAVARTKISDIMTIAGIPSGTIITDAVIATAITNNTIVVSSDGVPMINNTGVSTSPTTGTATAANLITDGFTNLQTYITTAATTTTSGITTIATNAEALLGTNNTKIITPATLNSSITQALTGNLTFRGSYNAATNFPNLSTPAAGAVGIGDYYVVSVAGTFFGNTLSVGDSLFSTVNNPSVFSDWTTVQVNVAYSTTLTQGLITLATAAEVQAGLDATKAVTSSTLHNTTNTPLLTKSGILNTALATPAQISAGTVNDTIAIDFGGISVARTKISDIMAIAGIPSGTIITDAVIATAVTSNEIVVSSDGVPMINNTGASMTPSTGTATAANLITDGFISVSNYMLTKFSQVTETVVTGNGVGITAPTGTTTVVPQTQVEVFWNGIRQMAGTDYSVAGTTITFTTAIPLGLKAYIRVTH